MSQIVQAHHYAPRSIDVHYSRLAYDNFMERIDAGDLLFNRQQKKQLHSFRDKLHRELTSDSCQFLARVSELYHAQLMASQKWVAQWAQQPLDFTLSEYYQDSLTDLSWKERWRKYVKLQVLKIAIDQLDSSESKPKPALLAELQKQVVERITCRLSSDAERYQQTQYLENAYLNALASAFDPHSNYFSRSEHDEFNESLSREALRYGFEVDRNDLGQLEVTHISPGSPAWKSNALNAGDLILAAREPSGTVKDFACLPMREVYQYLLSPQIESAVFTVLKQSGEEIELKLHKEALKVTENTIQSFVLKGERKLGYIYLPAFYTEMQSEGLPQGCATDVARELLKLKREGIEALIFDLRSNGGGSMLEAIRLAGIFIDYGTITISDQRNEKPQNLKDLDRGTIYQDPLLVLINGYSASASELFAAAMQDYHRGIVVGQNSFGKSTSQQVFPLNSKDYPGSFVKITTGAFYRIDGSSHQKQGVQPDIILPTSSSGENGERAYASALTTDSINKKSYARPLAPLSLSQLKANSEKRLAQDSAFAAMLKVSAQWQAEYRDKPIPLQLEAFTKWYQKVRHFSTPSVKNSLYQAQNPSYLKGSSSQLYQGEEVNVRAMNSIDRDLYILESYQILTDYLNLNPN